METTEVYADFYDSPIEVQNEMNFIEASMDVKLTGIGKQFAMISVLSRLDDKYTAEEVWKYFHYRYNYDKIDELHPCEYLNKTENFDLDDEKFGKLLKERRKVIDNLEKPTKVIKDYTRTRIKLEPSVTKLESDVDSEKCATESDDDAPLKPEKSNTNKKVKGKVKQSPISRISSKRVNSPVKKEEQESNRQSTKKVEESRTRKRPRKSELPTTKRTLRSRVEDDTKLASPAPPTPKRARRI